MDKNIKHIKKKIPEQYRIIHTSSATRAKSSDIHSGADNMFYCWQTFDGGVYYIESPTTEHMSSTPSISMYLNGELYKTMRPSRTYAGNGFIYECLFTGLSYGDVYFITSTYDDDTVYSINERTYIGGRGNSPTLSETDTTIRASMSSPYNKAYSMPLGILTFDSDYGSLNTYSRAARTLLYTSCLQSTEQDAILGKVGNFMSFMLDQYNEASDTWSEPSSFTTEAFITRFPDWAAPFKVGISSSSSVAYYSTFSTYVNNWISDVNRLLGKTQNGQTWFVRDDNISESEDGIRIILGSHADLWGYNPDTQEGESQVMYGHWNCTYWYTSDRAISHCDVQLCNELRGSISTSSAFKDITYEELTECLGCGNDAYHTYDSIFSEIWYIGKNNRLLNGNTPTVDGEVVQMLYKELQIGEPASTVVHKLTPSEAAIIQLPNNKNGVRGKNYEIKAYSMNRRVTWQNHYYYWDDSDNSYSDIGNPIAITPTSGRPDNWYWTTTINSTAYVPVDSLGFHPVTATEWNNFTSRINEFREYKGYSDYSFSTVSRGQVFTPAIYNQAVNAIKGISGYGSYLSTISSGTKLSADLFLSLRDELNAIP